MDDTYNQSTLRVSKLVRRTGSLQTLANLSLFGYFILSSIKRHWFLKRSNMVCEKCTYHIYKRLIVASICAVGEGRILGDS